MFIRRWLTAALMLVVFVSAAAPVAAQQASPCSSPEAGQFDFWLGDWELSWGDSGKGTNKITKVLDGCVILENFDGAPSRASGKPVKYRCGPAAVTLLRISENLFGLWSHCFDLSGWEGRRTGEEARRPAIEV